MNVIKSFSDIVTVLDGYHLSISGFFIIFLN